MPQLKLHWQILIAILLAILAGSLSGTHTIVLGVNVYEVYQFIGTLFLNALKMIVVPLIVASIITGVAGLGQNEGLGRLGLKTLGFYTLSSFLAIMIGLLMVNLVQPGLVNGQPAKAILGLDPQAVADVTAKVAGRDTSDIIEIFVRMIPTNVVDAAANGEMLGLIFFAILFGYFMTKTQKEHYEILMGFWQGIMDTMIAMTMWVMKFAPIGVFGLVAKTIASTGFAAIMPLLTFALVVFVGLMIHMFMVLPSLLLLFGKLNPKTHLKTMTPALLTAFSTASSSATLPMTLDCMQKAGVSNRTRSFVLPLGATVNMDGTALYECVAALFIAQAYGLALSIEVQFTVVLLALLTSIGVAGIPAASLVAITIILTAIGLPLEAIGLILVTDRILDMFRTAVNVYSDSCAAVIIAKSEKEAVYSKLV
jgi:Na+/H+-dicarboxylate symporter